MSATAVPQIFDPRRLALRRARALGSGNGFLEELMRAAVIDRLDDIVRSFDRALAIDLPVDEAASLSAQTGIAIATLEAGALLAGAELDEAPFPCILWPGGLDRIADVPGALVRCRQLLAPDGVLIGACWGDGSLATLLRTMIAADGAAPRARLHPQIDVRAIGDLLQRAGFALPVVDREPVTLRYRQLSDLIADLRGSALTNVLSGPVDSIGKSALARAEEAFGALRDEEAKVRETLVMIHFTGWRPDPSQPRPAVRGSAGRSLADALRKRD